MTRHLASAQNWAGLAGGDTGRLFYSKCNSFIATTGLLKCENLKVGIVQLCNELHVCNCTML